MAVACVAQPVHELTEVASCRQRTPKLGRSDVMQESTRGWKQERSWSAMHAPGIYSSGKTHHHTHTARFSQTTSPYPLWDEASTLVVKLLDQFHSEVTPYADICSPHEQEALSSTSTVGVQEDRAAGRTSVDSTAPSKTPKSQRRGSLHASSNMNSTIDLESSSGIRTRGKKGKKKAVQSFDPWGEDNSGGKDEGAGAGDNGTGGAGGDGGAGDGSATGGAGGDDGNNDGDGGGDDDTWNLGTNKKGKKKTKKQLEEEEEEKKRQEEEEQRMKEEEEAAAPLTNADPLSWANETDNAQDGDTWTRGWGTKNAKKKKKGVDDPPPPVPDAPPAVSSFQDINLDDSAPKLDFSLDGGSDTKKNSGSGSAAWGMDWDFGSAGKTEQKPDTKNKDAATSNLGDNNPWSLGSKSKSKTTFSTFDFGDLGTVTNDRTPLASEDAADTKNTDDAWGFSTSSKKKGTDEDKSGQDGQGAEGKTFKDDDGFSGWGTKSGKKKGKKDTEDLSTTNNSASMDWKSSSKTTRKDIMDEVEVEGPDLATKEPLAPTDTGDDWLSGAWGKNKKGKKKTGVEDFSTSIDLNSNVDTKDSTSDQVAFSSWTTWGTSKDKKTTTRDTPAGTSATDDDIWANLDSSKNRKDVTAEPSADGETPSVPLVAWDEGLSPVQKRKKERQMRQEFTWDARVTQEMVDEQAAQATATAAAAEAAKNDLATLEEPPAPAQEEVQEEFHEPKEPLVAWDAGLNKRDRARKEKQMRADGTWDDRITQQMVDDEAADAAKAAAASEVEPEPVVIVETTSLPVDEPPSLAEEMLEEPLVVWDHGLTAVGARKKEKAMRADGTWDARVTREMVDDQADKAAAAAAAATDPGVATEFATIEDTTSPGGQDAVVEDAPLLAPEPMEPLVAWDHGLTAAKKTKKEKAMRKDHTWDSRITQEMVDDRAAKIEAAAAAVQASVVEAAAVEELPPPEPESKEPLVAWDAGLGKRDRAKKEKQMRLDNTWDTRVTQDMIDEEAAKAATAEAEAAEVADALADVAIEESAPGVEELTSEPLVAWDHGLTASQKRKKQKQMMSEGTWESRMTQEVIDGTAPVTTTVPPTEASALEESQSFDVSNAIEELEPAVEKTAWDLGLSEKEKKRREKEMRRHGTWEERITQEQIDAEAEAKSKLLDAPTPTIEPELVMEPSIEGRGEPGIEALHEEKVSWDFGSSPKEKKRREKEKKFDGAWEAHITPETIAGEAETQADNLAGPPEVPANDVLKGIVQEVEKAPEEEKVAWDSGLDSKAKKRKEKQMRLDGTWKDRITQEQIDEEIANRAAAADTATEKAAAAAEHLFDDEPQKEEKIAWDFGLDDKDKRTKRKQMKLDGTWEGRVTQEAIDAEAAAAGEVTGDLPEELQEDMEDVTEHIEEEPVKQKKVPWDFELTEKAKKRQEKLMRADGTWAKRITQEQIDEEDAAAAAAAAATDLVADKGAEFEPTTDLLDDETPKEDSTWSTFGWGGKDNKKKEPAQESSKAGDSWGVWGLLSKDKKKKSATPVEPEPEPEPEAEETVPTEGDGLGWASPAKDSKTEKSAKKATSKSSKEEIPTIDVGTASAQADDPWAFWGKTDKKMKKGKKSEELPPPVPSPPAQGLTPERSASEANALEDFDWTGLEGGKETKSKGSEVEESLGKKSSSSLWSFGGTGTGAKTKKEKEKEARVKKESEEQAQREKEEKLKREAEEAGAEAMAAEAAAAVRAAEATKPTAEAIKPTKKSKSSKLNKVESTEEKKKGMDLLDFLEEPMPTPGSSKLKKTSTRGSTGQPISQAKYDEPVISDYFGAWGGADSSKKPTGKKADGTKKEINKQGSTNDEDALADLMKDLEFPANEASTPSSKASKTMPGGKTKAGSSIADRIKSLEGKNEKEAVGKKSKSQDALLTKEVPIPEPVPTPKEEKRASKAQTAKASKAKDVQPPSPVLQEEKKKSKESVPGSFPGAFEVEEDDPLNDDGPEPTPAPTFIEELEPEPVTKKTSKGASKPKKTKTKKTSFEPVLIDEMEDVGFTSPPADTIDAVDESKLPTPPPEDKKTPKKERARVERGASSSWGFWAATPPPKTTKSKADSASPTEAKREKPPMMVRSKTVRSSRDREGEEARETERQSSASDKESRALSSDRPKGNRGMGLAGFVLGGAPPSAMRSRPTRRTSTNGSRSSSRRASVDASGMMSPPPEDDMPIFTEKSAKLTGVKSSKPDRKRSSRDKSKAYVDPYPIDDDDMVMINPGNRPVMASRPTEKAKGRVVATSRRESRKPRSKTISGDEDVVMVDGPAGGDLYAMSGAEDVLFVNTPPTLSRSNTGPMRKSGGFLSNFFGGTKMVAEMRSAPVSAPATDVEEEGLPIRTKSSSRRRSRTVEPVDGFTTDAPIDTDADVARRAARRARRDARERAEEEERLAREQGRRERREREKADLEARRERARDQARKEREMEEQRREEKRSRRKEKEAAERARVVQEEAELEAAAEKRREERRRLREQLEAAEAAKRGVSQDDRRRKFNDEEEERRRRREERKLRDTKEKIKPSSRRKSSALVEEYHESRSGSGRGIKPPANKTSSWIDSQQEIQPEFPSIEPTVLDESGQRARPVDDADSGSRRRRKDKHTGMTEDEIIEHRARRRAERRTAEKSMSGGSDEKQQHRRRRAEGAEEDYYSGGNVRTFDGRPALGRTESKRNSFFGKLGF